MESACANKTQRQSNIELLRILAMLGVIILHYNNPLVGGAIVYSAEYPINNLILYVFESMTICAVDLFMVISGYFMCNITKRSLWKPLELIVQVIVISGSFYILTALINQNFSVKGLIGRLIPNNYFVILYCTVYLVSPYVSSGLDKLDSANLKRMMIVCFGLFSIYPITVNFLELLVGRSLIGLNSISVSGDQAGYNITNFLLCWTIGAYIRKRKLQVSKNVNAVCYICTTAVILVASLVLKENESAWDAALSYCNPFVIVQASSLFSFFKQKNMGSIKFVNKLAEGAFMVFLMHSVFLYHIGIEFFAVGNPWLMALHVVLSAMVIFLICWCIHVVYDFTMSNIWRKLKLNIKLPEVGIL